MVDEILSYQIDRMTRAWVRERVSLSDPPLPQGGAILLSIHQWNQRLAFARLADVTTELGWSRCGGRPRLTIRGWRVRRVSTLRTAASWHSVGPASRSSARGCFRRAWQPGVVSKLLNAGGSLIVLADFYGQSLTPILGHLIPVADGVAWLAEQSGPPDRAIPDVTGVLDGAGGRWCTASRSSRPKRRCTPKSSALSGVQPHGCRGAAGTRERRWTRR